MDTSKSNQPSIYARIAEVRSSVGTVPKEGFNKFHGYRYVKVGDILEAVNPLLKAHDLVIIPSVVESKTTAQQDGNLMVEVMVEYDIRDTTSNQQTKVRSPGHGRDKGDKGVYKAMTGSMKYMLIEVFGIATDDDPENETEEKADKPQAEKPATKTEGTKKDITSPCCKVQSHYHHTDEEYGDVYHCEGCKKPFRLQAALDAINQQANKAMTKTVKPEVKPEDENIEEIQLNSQPTTAETLKNQPGDQAKPETVKAPLTVPDPSKVKQPVAPQKPGPVPVQAATGEKPLAGTTASGDLQKAVNRSQTTKPPVQQTKPAPAKVVPPKKATGDKK
jgi:hypothetical protein